MKLNSNVITMKINKQISTYFLFTHPAIIRYTFAAEEQLPIKDGRKKLGIIINNKYKW